jgi:hypothetical protein
MNNNVYNDRLSPPRETDEQRLVVFPGKIVRQNGVLAFQGLLTRYFSHRSHGEGGMAR